MNDIMSPCSEDVKLKLKLTIADNQPTTGQSLIKRGLSVMLFFLTSIHFSTLYNSKMLIK